VKIINLCAIGIRHDAIVYPQKHGSCPSAAQHDRNVFVFHWFGRQNGTEDCGDDGELRRKRSIMKETVIGRVLGCPPSSLSSTALMWCLQSSRSMLRWSGCA